jgi:hypothetical protein
MTSPVTKHPAAVALGRLGGLAGGTTSHAKAEACRRNGRLGGRPPSRKDRKLGLAALRKFASEHDTLDDAAAALSISRQWLWTLLNARARPSARILTLLRLDRLEALRELRLGP